MDEWLYVLSNLSEYVYVLGLSICIKYRSNKKLKKRRLLGNNQVKAN